MAKASIIMPVKNGEEFIEKTLKSIIDQTEKDIEIIIVNDHSTDGTVKVVKSIQKKDKRIQLFHNPKELTGEANTRNYGSKIATSDTLFPADADDPCRANRIELSLNKMQKTKADFFYATLEHYFSNTGKEEKRFYQPYNRELLNYINFINHTSVAYTKKAFTDLGGYDPSIKIGTDYDLWLRATEKGYKFCSQNIVVCQYTIHDKQMTSTSFEERHKWLRIIRKKHNIYNIDINYIKNNANQSAINFFLKNPKYKKIWFDPQSIP